MKRYAKLSDSSRFYDSTYEKMLAERGMDKKVKDSFWQPVKLSAKYKRHRGITLKEEKYPFH